MNKTLAFILLVAVAAAEGRARGAKLGQRRIRQQSLWGRPRQDPYGQSPVGGQPSPEGYPQPTVPAETPAGYPQPGGSGAPSVPAGAYPPVSPTPVTSSGIPQQGYPSGTQPPQTPIIVPGNISPASIPTCLYPGFFPTPGSCVNFYRCVDWTGTGSSYTVFQFNCPLGTIFDDELDTCSHIAWVVPKRPECEYMLASSLVPIGSGPPQPGAGGAPGGGYGPGTGVVPQPPVQPPVVPGVGYPQPGGGQVGTVSPPVIDGSAPPIPFTLECFSGQAYRRHPLYCNRYYRCQWDGSDWVFPMLTCPRGLIFNEAGQNCADPATIATCSGQIAAEPTPEGSDGTDTTSTSVTDSTTTEDSPTTPGVDPSSLYDCPAKGYYPFEGDCIRFYKCVELDSGLLKGLLYKCPEQYGYSEDKKRCDKEERLPTCTKSPTPAHLRLAPARELTVEDLAWFFNTY